MNLILIYFVFSSAFASDFTIISPPKIVPSGAEKFECGIYMIAGELSRSANGQSYLTVYPGTSRGYPIQLKKFNSKDAIILNEAFVRVKLQVTKSGVGNAAQFVTLEKSKITTKSNALHEPVSKVASKACSL